jgi:hypothetical protein
VLVESRHLACDNGSADSTRSVGRADDTDAGTVEASRRQNAADGRENAWATGTNPAVDSIYQRLAAKSPEYAGHQFNLAADGATVTDMIGQADYLPRVHPAPAVVFVQGGDDDMKCGGTDAQNYAPFQASFTTLLRDITTQAPKANIYVLSMFISAANYANLIAALPSVKAQNEGSSPCAPFDANGNRSASGIAYQQDDIDHLSVDPTDLTADGNDLVVPGLRKYADLVWSTFFQN